MVHCCGHIIIAIANWATDWLPMIALGFLGDPVKQEAPQEETAFVCSFVGSAVRPFGRSFGRPS